MGKAKDSKKCFQSRYSDSLITPAQYICELICEKNAQQNQRELPRYFWKFDEWKTFFIYQSKVAHQLLKTHSHESIIKALQDKRSYSVFSLRNAFLVTLIKEYERARIHISDIPKITDDLPNIFEKPKKQKTKNVLDKLSEMDNGL